MDFQFTRLWANLDQIRIFSWTSVLVVAYRTVFWWATFVRWHHDTIRYDTIYLRALKSWRDGQPNLSHGTQTKNREN